MDEPEGRKKVVFDTGTVLQATLSDTGPAFQAIRLLDEEKIVAFISPRIRSEYEDVLTRVSIHEKNPALTEERARAMLERFDQKVIMVFPNPPRYVEYQRDPDDEPILNLAIHVRADYIVARDRDLLDLGSDAAFRQAFPFLTILTPVALFQEIALKHQPEQRQSQAQP